MSVSMTVRLHDRFADAEAAIQQELAVAVVDAGQEAVEVMQDFLYPGHGYRTGELHDGIHFDPDQPLGGTLRSDAPYSGWVNWGTSHMAAIPFFDAGIAALPQSFTQHGKFTIRKLS